MIMLKFQAAFDHYFRLYNSEAQGSNHNQYPMLYFAQSECIISV